MNITRPEVIEQYEQIHKTKKYGQSARSAALSIQLCIDELKPQAILEYGCGQSQLHAMLKTGDATFDRYDPAIPDFKTIPRERYDLLISTDVLEHIPTDDVPGVLAHIHSLAPHAFLRISTRLARTILPDGRNAHFTVWPGAQWLEAICNYYPEAAILFEIPDETCLILSWKSAVAAEITAHEERLEKRRRSPVKLFLKRIERRVRRVRDRLLKSKKNC